MLSFPGAVNSYSLHLIGFSEASNFPEFVRFSASRFAVIEPRHVLDL
jgi:hypothetical protein